MAMIYLLGRKLRKLLTGMEVSRVKLIEKKLLGIDRRINERWEETKDLKNDLYAIFENADTLSKEEIVKKLKSATHWSWQPERRKGISQKELNEEAEREGCFDSPGFIKAHEEYKKRKKKETTPDKLKRILVNYIYTANQCKFSLNEKGERVFSSLEQEYMAALLYELEIYTIHYYVCQGEKDISLEEKPSYRAKIHADNLLTLEKNLRTRGKEPSKRLTWLTDL